MGTPKSAIVLSQCFGTMQYMSKEDHDRERNRWQQRLDETEEKLLEMSNANSHMMQIKAQLNKKIIEFEKNQRPLIEQNKRLNERNKILTQDIRKVNDKLTHAQTDMITLKDSYDRLVKENTLLKEQRTFPEKLKELDRYRNQALEYSKCITALRQAGIEKDKRFDLLLQKYRKLRRAVLNKGNIDFDEDKMSQIGSDCSMESFSCLDTINEDLLEFEDVERHIKNELYNCNAKNNDDNNNKEEEIKELTDKIEQQKYEICQLKEKCNNLECEISNNKESNDLLEFQILEMSENMKEMLPINSIENERKMYNDLIKQVILLINTTSQTVDNIKDNLPKVITKLNNICSKLYINLDEGLDENKIDLINNRVSILNKNIQAIIKERVECDKVQDAERDAWKEELGKMYDQLQIALQNIKILEEKEYPIRSLLERRLEESRYRLKESMQTIENYENLMEEANKRLAQLEVSEKRNEELEKKVMYLQSYVTEFEQQFTAQIDVINLLKKQLELVR
uniref:JAKMIP_CC3 domain-containing protein n=1 Tax=Parastrongyloides trichosuri TaxID=131310 RepID=A0A0N4Z337_PARTI